MYDYNNMQGTVICTSNREPSENYENVKTTITQRNHQNHENHENHNYPENHQNHPNHKINMVCHELLSMYGKPMRL